MGVRYAELSFSRILEAECLRQVHRLADVIEREVGVTLRFLAALNRHDDLEWDLDCLDRIAEIGRSRYLAGVDFMGHETNSTHAFAEQIRRVARWAHAARPGFVIRIHAGENPSHPKNVRVGWDSVRGADVQLRIGHGLFGTDDQTMAGLRESGAIVEFNLSSNLALNNVQAADQIPLMRYLDHGVPVVLGTDGYGIYQTSLEMEVQAAWLCGLGESEIGIISDRSTRVVAGGDDAQEARWFRLPQVPGNLAFDHGQILRDGQARLATVEG
jgi:adenosine deaminase